MRTRVYTIPFMLFMPQELLSRLKDAAAREYKTQSGFVRESILEKIEREKEAAPVSASRIQQGLTAATETSDTPVIAHSYAASSVPLS